MKGKILAVDAWATPCPPEAVAKWPDEFKHIFRRYGSIERFEKGISIDEMVAEMDEAGVEIAALSAFDYQGVHVVDNSTVTKFVERYPKRFIGVGTVDPRGRPMDALRQIERLVKDFGMKGLRLEPYAYGDGTVGTPPNAKMYWPIYAKCVELDIAVSIQVGHTGPLLPSEPGRPIYLDEVALAFPELTILGCHLGQPWHEEMMILAWKHPNVYVETSARAPKHWPPSFVDFVKTWGQDKVIWATDYPLLTFKRCLDEIEAMNLAPVVKRKLIRENALKAFKVKIE
ncbi:MAG: amidohydrolase [Chloroflexi bacterium]|nr:amidohydrolase [Chloroflexota bacterium]